jgi:hypothetical protein
MRERYLLSLKRIILTLMFVVGCPVVFFLFAALVWGKAADRG